MMTDEQLLEEYSKQELKEMRDQNVIATGKISDEDLKKIENALKKRDSFYRFFAVEYYATGEGITYFLQVCTNCEVNDIDRDLDCFKRFIDDDFFAGGIEELKEKEFMERFVSLIPSHMVKMIERKDQPSLMWQTHYHVNYS
jgi:hypothetical protein